MTSLECHLPRKWYHLFQNIWFYWLYGVINTPLRARVIWIKQKKKIPTELKISWTLITFLFSQHFQQNFAIKNLKPSLFLSYLTSGSTSKVVNTCRFKDYIMSLIRSVMSVALPRFEFRVRGRWVEFTIIYMQLGIALILPPKLNYQTKYLIFNGIGRWFWNQHSRILFEKMETCTSW